MLKSRWKVCVIGGGVLILGIQMSVQAGLGDWKIRFVEESKKIINEQTLKNQNHLISMYQNNVIDAQEGALGNLQNVANHQVVSVTTSANQMIERLGIDFEKETEWLVKKNKECFDELTIEQMEQIDNAIENGILEAMPEYSYRFINVTTSSGLRLEAQQESQALQDLYSIVLERYNQSEYEVMKDYYKRKLQEVEKLYEIVQGINERME
ncbi:hypothetical protein PBV87_05050 [Niameybacter massiliensis]|uniref:Uncharacterized protein n=1 Tax=Holtiella tumoricola TaxID=3018743 RepID=A0AA42DKU3_9FIRM|nr:hypothetical protein [Holtiella tumoricola]MDA3730866.1 hypothetical protein [Holtiella tumoricola]